MAENIIQSKSFNFSIKLVKLIYWIEKFQFDPLLKQLLRSWTSVWANIEEALWGQSKQDFIHKLSIAQKEIRETKYRLRIIIETHIWITKDWQGLLYDAEEISRILTKIITTTKINLDPKKVIENWEF